MANGSLGLTNAANNFVSTFMMGRQKKEQDAALEKQNQIKTLMGNMLMGNATQDQAQQLAQLAPEQYLGASQYIQGQQAQQAEANRVLNDERDKTDLMTMLTLDDTGQQEILKQRIMEVEEAGGDASDSRQLLGMDAGQRNKFFQMKASEYGITMPEEKVTAWQQGTGDMTGYAFNPETGEYQLDENIKTTLEAKAAEKANTDLGIDDKRSINNDVTALSRDPKKIQNAAARLESISGTKSPTDQLAAIFTFMKALDPASVVREGEQQMAMKTGGLTDTMLTYVERLKSGDSLPPEVFENMVLTAKRLSNQAITDASKDVSGYLNAYGDSIDDKQKSLYLGRMPELFEITEEAAQDTTSTPVIDANAMSEVDSIMSELGL